MFSNHMATPALATPLLPGQPAQSTTDARHVSLNSALHFDTNALRDRMRRSIEQVLEPAITFVRSEIFYLKPFNQT